MKKLLVLFPMAMIFCAILWFSVPAPVQAQEEYNGLLLGLNTASYWEDGANKRSLTHPKLVNGVTYVPLRLVVEYLGKDVVFNETDRSATVTDKATGNWINFNQKTNIATTDKGNIPLEKAPFIQDDCYMVPVRILSEYFLCGVYWNNDTKGILVTKAPTEKEQQDSQGLLLRYHDGSYFENGFVKSALTRVEIFNGTSYLPLRIVSEYLGAKVGWNPKDGTATLTMEGTEKWLTLNAKDTFVQTNTGNIAMERAPFIQNDCYMVPVRIISEFFGCFVPWNQELQSFLITKNDLSEEEKNMAFTPMKNRVNYIKLSQNPQNGIQVETKSYGKSGQGRDLSYTSIYRSGYTKTVMMVFAQHGFEDNYARDGQVLVNLANAVIADMKKGSPALDRCRLLIVSCANPDGIAAGTTKNGPGRCTVVGGVDMNRDWPTKNYVPRSEPRYKTTSPLSCAETKNLHNMIVNEDPDILLDIHGWLNTTYGDETLGNIFKNNLSLSSEAYTFELTEEELRIADEEGMSYAAADNYASGYLMRWAQEQGMRSALIELKSPKNINTAKFIDSVEQCMNL